MIQDQDEKKDNNIDENKTSELTDQMNQLSLASPDKLDLPEPLLMENPDRYVVFPIVYQDIYDMYQTHVKAIWMVAEINLSQDIKHWKALNDGERHFIKNVLAFFAASDGIIMENLSTRFTAEVQLTEARLFYGIQNFMEGIHSETYALLIETYIDDTEEKYNLFKAIETVPTVKRKAKWAQKWISSEKSFATRLVAFAVVEGLFFSGSFCCIYWLKEQGKMPGLCFSNDFIARDENLHCMFAALLYTRYIVNKLSQNEIAEIVKEAVEIEEEFIIDSLPCSLLGMNSNMMREYIQYVANRLLKQLGYEEIYSNVKQPFPFMERINLNKMSNFFEVRVSNYKKPVISMEEIYKKAEWKFDMDF